MMCVTYNVTKSNKVSVSYVSIWLNRQLNTLDPPLNIKTQLQNTNDLFGGEVLWFFIYSYYEIKSKFTQKKFIDYDK